MSASTSDRQFLVAMIIIRCSIKAARWSRKLGKWDEAEKFDTLEAEIAESIRAQVTHTAYSRIFGEWRVKSLLVIARVSIEKNNTEQATAIHENARDVIAKLSAAEFTQQQPSLKSPVKRLLAQYEEVIKLQGRCNPALLISAA
jgi:hypothetical protein